MSKYKRFLKKNRRKYLKEIGEVLNKCSVEALMEWVHNQGEGYTAYFIEYWGITDEKSKEQTLCKMILQAPYQIISVDAFKWAADKVMYEYEKIVDNLFNNGEKNG